MTWNGLAFAAAAEAAGPRHTGAALGFQQTLLGVVVATAPPAFAAIAASSWRLAFALAAIGPLAGVVLLLARLRGYESRAKTRNVGDPAGSSSNSGLTQPSSPVRCS